MKLKKQVTLVLLLVLAAGYFVLGQKQETKIEATNQNKEKKSQQTLSKQAPSGDNLDVAIMKAQKAYDKAIERGPATKPNTSWEEAETIAANLREKLNAQEDIVFKDDNLEEDQAIDDGGIEEFIPEEHIVVAQTQDEKSREIQNHLQEVAQEEEEVSQEQFQGNYFEY